MCVTCPNTKWLRTRHVSKRIGWRWRRVEINECVDYAVPSKYDKICRKAHGGYSKNGVFPATEDRKCEKCFGVVDKDKEYDDPFKWGYGGKSDIGSTCTPCPAGYYADRIYSYYGGASHLGKGSCRDSTNRYLLGAHGAIRTLRRTRRTRNAEVILRAWLTGELRNLQKTKPVSQCSARRKVVCVRIMEMGVIRSI